MIARTSMMIVLAVAVFLTVFPVAVSPAEAQVLFSTKFNGTENPLSEGGVWLNLQGPTKVQKLSGIALGTQDGTNGYDDSYAYLRREQTAAGTGAWPANLRLTAIISRPVSVTEGPHEVELHHRVTESNYAGSARLYEVSLGFGGDITIVRWDGAIGFFVQLAQNLNGPVPQDGDEFSSTMVGCDITASLNGTVLLTASDCSYTYGSPGIGFFRREGGQTTDLGLKSFSVSRP